MSADQVVKVLGGVNAASRFFGVKPPSVSQWLAKGAIPDAQLISFAGRLEVATGGAFDRRAQWPDKFHLIWPELAAQRIMPAANEASAPVPEQGAAQCA